MPLNDSMHSEKTERAQDEIATPAREETPAGEEMETPIEVSAQEQAEREFETQRKLPPFCNKAIVSVDGKDVEQMPMGHRAA